MCVCCRALTVCPGIVVISALSCAMRRRLLSAILAANKRTAERVRLSWVGRTILRVEGLTRRICARRQNRHTVSVSPTPFPCRTQACRVHSQHTSTSLLIPPPPHCQEQLRMEIQEATRWLYAAHTLIAGRHSSIKLEEGLISDVPTAVCPSWRPSPPHSSHFHSQQQWQQESSLLQYHVQRCPW